MKLEPRYKNIEIDGECSSQGLEDFMNAITDEKRRPGTVHMMLTHIDDPNIPHKGKAIHGTICDQSPNRAVGVVRWLGNAMETAVTFAHEVAHTYGMYHDNEEPKNGWRETCEDGNVYVMTPGNPLQKKLRSTWSECSNKDFRQYWFNAKIAAHKNGFGYEFCLKGKKCDTLWYLCDEN